MPNIHLISPFVLSKSRQGETDQLPYRPQPGLAHFSVEFNQDDEKPKQDERVVGKGCDGLH
jgi:hypothetical protein